MTLTGGWEKYIIFRVLSTCFGNEMLYWPSDVRSCIPYFTTITVMQNGVLGPKKKRSVCSFAVLESGACGVAGQGCSLLLGTWPSQVPQGAARAALWIPRTFLNCLLETPERWQTGCEASGFSQGLSVSSSLGKQAWQDVCRLEVINKVYNFVFLGDKHEFGTYFPRSNCDIFFK